MGDFPVNPHKTLSSIMPTAHLLVAAAFALVLLSFAVGLRLLFVRSQEMRAKRVHPQAASTSLAMAAKLQDVQAADNFRNLFEVPVLFYALVAMSVAVNFTPTWLALGAWLFVVLRVAHSLIHCSYNRVMHRFAAFGTSFLLLVGLWAAFVFSLLDSSSV